MSSLSWSVLSLNKRGRQTNTFILVYYYEPHAHACLPHSYLAGNNLCHLLQLCLNKNQKAFSLLQVKSCEFKSSKERKPCIHMGFNLTCQLVWKLQLPWLHKDFHLRPNFLSCKGKPREKGKTRHLRGSSENSRLGDTIWLSIFLEKVGCSAGVAFCNSLDTLAVCSMNEHFFTSARW